MLRKKVCSDILPHFGVTSCLAHRDILPDFRATSCLAYCDILPRPFSPPACLLARQKPQRRHNAMYSKDPHGQKNAQNGPGTPSQSPSSSTTKRLILKISEPACLCREDDPQGDEEEQPRRIRDMQKGGFRHDAGRAAVRGQNWRDRTSAFFAVLGS